MAAAPKNPVDPAGAARVEVRSRAHFDALAQRYAGEARRFVRRKLDPRLRRRLGSDDVLQESLLEAARVFLEGAGPASQDGEDFLPWLRKVIEHKIANLARHHKADRRDVRREHRAGEGLAAVGAGQRTPSAEASLAEESAIVRRAITMLPPRQREVVTLVHVQKLSVAQAAKRMGKTPGSTSVLLHQALRKLRALLAPKED